MPHFEPVHYLPTEHPHFDNLAALLISLASLETALTAYANEGFVQAPRNIQNAIHIGGRSMRRSFHTYDLLHGASVDKWPESLVIFRSRPEDQVDFHRGSRDLFSSGLHRAIEQMVGAAFVKFYESRLRHWKNAMGSQPKNWPDLWRFGWVLRNAIAHGDQFSIDDPTFAPCSWRCFRVDRQHNGRRWFDIDGGFLGGGDVLELIDELHCTRPART